MKINEDINIVRDKWAIVELLAYGSHILVK